MHLQVRNRVETVDEFVGLEGAVRAIADRHKTTASTLQIEAIGVTIDDTNVRRRLWHDAERRHDRVLLSANITQLD